MAGINLKDWQAMSKEQQQKYFDSTENDYVARGNLFSMPGVSFEHVKTTKDLPHKSPRKENREVIEGLLDRETPGWREKPEPEWRKKLEDIADVAGDKAVHLSHQADTTIALAKKCEMHPFLHSFIDLNDTREAVQRIMGQDPQLYANGNTDKFLLDSAFDEIIDVIVGNLEGCQRG